MYKYNIMVEIFLFVKCHCFLRQNNFVFKKVSIESTLRTAKTYLWASIAELKLILSYVIAFPESLVSGANRPIGIILELIQLRAKVGPFLSIKAAFIQGCTWIAQSC